MNKIENPFTYGMLNPGNSPTRGPASGDESGNLEVYDGQAILAHTINQVEKDKNRKFKSAEFLGIILEHNTVLGSWLLARTSAGFRDSLGAGKGPNISNKKFDEYIVYIPEVNGYFPSFDYKRYIDLKNQYSTRSPSKVAKSKKTQAQSVIKDHIAEFEEIKKKLNRFPRFYKISSGTAASAKTQSVCKIKFPNMNYLSYGHFLGFQ